ncbi:ATP-binding protein [Aeromicrobium sp. 179-A 4D2 NHS]|uniref:ATP-binding protein n=1 Tax=Aeromicrobium sp. 179-A 4D2 NHS TaxID=3142375 RepID=UPI0039A00B95
MEQYRDQHEITGTWATRERIVAAVTGGPESATLMRRAARIASRRAGGEWLALYVTRHDGLSAISPDRLTELRARAEELGGTFHTVVGDDAGDAILAFARAENADQVIIGASRRGRLSTLVRPGIGERVIAASGDIDVHIVTHDYARQQARAERGDHTLGARRRLAGFVFAVAAPTLVSLLLWQTPSLHGLPSEAMVLMALVVATALIGGLLPAVLSAVLSGVLLNLLFTPPRYTLTIAEPENAAAIVLFVLVGIAVATVVDHSARQAARARRARAEADSLTVLAHSLLSSSDDPVGLLSSACELFGADGAAVLRRSGPAEWEVLAAVGDAPASIGDDVVSTAIDEQTFLALRGGGRGDSERSLLNAYAAYAKVMDERGRARAAEIDGHRLVEADRTRTALLAAVSHDLRSPLAAVKAAVSSLRSTSVAFSPEDEAALLETIEESTDRLTSLVTNLLDMSRIHTGAVTVHPSEVGLAEAARTAIAPIEGGERITVSIDESLVAVADPGLLDRVLANLSENALKHTPPDAEVRLDAAAVGDRVTLRLADTGPGIDEQDLDRIFAPFQRLGDVPGNDGVGLGLAVARGLTEAMGGTITTEATPGGGLTFAVDLPRAPEETP